MTLHYREHGRGDDVLVFLHGGWGYDVYPFDRQTAALGSRYRILIPDRSGYGRSSRGACFDADFHRRAAGETLGLLDALDVQRAVLWGHSDGAVIAALVALEAPARVRALIVEAIHFFRVKPRSRAFFETMVHDPERLGARVCATLAREHGDPYWRELLQAGGSAWLHLADEAPTPQADLYEGRLDALTAPALVLHGARDPRTEPGELEALARALPNAEFRVLADGGHAPHSERDTAAACTAAAITFLAGPTPTSVGPATAAPRRQR
ncbi:MAG: alpha/beta hydrolase [Chloroflexota bacterium]|nr:alpha/beta hydrolase [Chloroflexota bacterium]